MKNIFKLSLITLGLFLGFSCSGNNPSSNTTTSSSTTTEEVKQVSKWGEQYSDLIIGTLGEDIPYIACPSFDVVSSKDDYGDPMVIIYLYFPSSDLDAKLEEYATIADYAGYTVNLESNSYFDESSFTIYTYDVYYADKVISPSKGIEMQFLIGSNKYKDCIGIFAYNYTFDDANSWPTNLVTSLLGHDIPHLEDTGEYSYYAKINAEGYIDMIIYNVPLTAEDDYIALLEENGFFVTDEIYDEETGEYMGRFAYDPNGEYVIQFGLSIYGLEIYIYKI